MNLQETVELIAVLKAAGVSHFKSLEHDIVLRAEGASSVAHTHAPAGATPAPATNLENAEDTARAVELINTLKLSPEALADQIFPDGV